MPKLINYLNRVSPGRSYTDEELNLMQLVYDRACIALDITAGDPRRERLALVVFELYSPALSSDALIERVVASFGRLG